MKYLYFIVFQIFIFISINIEAQVSTKIDINSLDNYIQKSADEWKIPGLAFAIFNKDSIIFSKGYGVRDINKKDKVDSKTIFAVASNTKSFTAAALSLLVSEGKISWDDKVIKYLPYFQLYSPYVTSEFTIRDLLCHRSGLETFSGDLLWYESTYSRKEVIERAKFLKPKYGFRSHFGYSNIMYSAAGEIIPAVTDTSWEDFIKARLLKPLNMQHSNTCLADLKKEKNVAQPHNILVGQKPETINYMNWNSVAAAAALNSNVEEMSNWLMMNLNLGTFNGKKILNEDRIFEMQSPQTILEGSKYTTQTHFEAYGLGWEMFDFCGKKVIHHSGGADGMISITVMVPEENFGFVVLTNSVNYLPSALLYYILNDYFDQPTKDWSNLYYKYYLRNDKETKDADVETDKNRDKNSKPSLPLDQYTGIYGGELYGNASVELVEGKLVVKLLPTPIFVGDLTHFQYDCFKIKLRNSPSLPSGTVNFILGADGKPEELRINIPNPDFDFTELEFKKVK